MLKSTCYSSKRNRVVFPATMSDGSHPPSLLTSVGTTMHMLSLYIELPLMSLTIISELLWGIVAMLLNSVCNCYITVTLFFSKPLADNSGPG